jgi:hypothetical protein
MRANPNGYVIHSDRWRVVIAVGFANASTNRKTGPMIQIFILTRANHPVIAKQKGTDRLICYDCPIKSECYVETWKSPAQVWGAWGRGAYPDIKHARGGWGIFRGLGVRFGAYGDPYAIPLAKIARIAQAADSWTGYTHQHHRADAKGYKRYLMASVESVEGAAEAQARGWRTFRIGDDAAGDILCPAHNNKNLHPSQLRGRQCIDCGLCAGSSRRAKSIFEPAHGSRAKSLTNR